MPTSSAIDALPLRERATLRRRFLSAVLLLSFGFTLRATAETAEQMLSACRPIAKAEIRDNDVRLPETFGAGQCWGAFATLPRFVRMVDPSGRPVFGICRPSEGKSSRTQWITIFVKYADDHPEVLGRDFADVVLASLQHAFPCKQNTR